MSELNQMIAKCLRLDLAQVTPQLTMQNCERWDSLSHMNLITQLEQHYSVQFSMDEMIQMTSLQNIAELLQTKCRVSV